jgi:CSLREA domain-containing protein
MKKSLTTLALVVGLVVALAGSATAGTLDLVVTKTADTNDGACTAEDCSLREAIVHANAFGADNIDVPAGTYKLTITGAKEDLAATGDLDIRRGVAIRGAGARNTIIDGGGIDRVFHMPTQFISTPHTVSISGVKITGGSAPTDFIGGGIAHLARGANLNLSDSTVSANSAANGGGIHNGAEQTFGGSMTIRRSTISGNEAPGGQGGGIRNATTLTIEDTTVSSNRSTFGGGILSYTPMKITDSTIAFNTAQQPGGGIFVNSDTATLKNTIVSSNKSNFASKNCNSPDRITSDGNNLEKGTSCGLTKPTDLNADPKLGRLANNGGPTNTHAPERGSPVTNAGGDPYPATDQRGVARPQGVANDIGAYEKKQNTNVVQCPTGGSSFQCVGTGAGEALVGRDGAYDQIQGEEGDDTYNGKGGCDFLEDAGLTSSDRYLVSVKDFCTIGTSALELQDDGGKNDVLDLSRFYKSSDFVFYDNSSTLYMDGPGLNDIFVDNFFATGSGTADSIETFKFSDKPLTARQVRDMI